MYGRTALSEFGIEQLEAVRKAMVKDGRVRNQVNRRVGMVRMFLRWCVSRKMFDGTALEMLRSLKPLSPGRDGAKEGKPVLPADPIAVDKVLPLLPPALCAAANLLRFTGDRPSEILKMRPRELDQSSDVWTLSPTWHKGSWRGKSRTIYIGPEARAVLGACPRNPPVRYR